MIIKQSEIGSVDLKSYVKFISRNDHKSIFLDPPGKNHYHLLGYLSLKVSNGLIIELGTHHGTGSLALSINKSNRVITYDIKDRFGIKPQPENVTRRIGNIFDLHEESILLDSNLIFLDTAHTGVFELKIYEFLLNNGYKGILLLDDIHWNKEMRNFWTSIETTKYDLTSVGHGICPDGAAGTGLVDFSGNINID